MKVLLLVLGASFLTMGECDRVVEMRPQPTSQPNQAPETNWNRKNAVPQNTKYSDLPSDLRLMADRIEQSDKIYRNTKKAATERCKALITVHRNLVPLLIAFNMGRPFTILGPNSEKAEVKVQTGFYVSRVHSVWHQTVKCHQGKAASLLHPNNPRPLLPLFYK